MQILRFSDVIASDKFVYLPAIGLLMILAAFLACAAEKTFPPNRYYNFHIAHRRRRNLRHQKLSTITGRTRLRLYKHMISLAPDSAPLYGNLGNTYGRLGQYEEALDALKTAAKLQPNEPAAHYNLGVNYLKLGRYNEAIDEFKKTVELNPDYADAWNNLGFAYGVFKRYDDQVYACKKAIELKPDNFDASQSRFRLRQPRTAHRGRRCLRKGR